jgi:hypothetical protein
MRCDSRATKTTRIVLRYERNTALCDMIARNDPRKQTGNKLPSRRKRIEFYCLHFQEETMRIRRRLFREKSVNLDEIRRVWQQLSETWSLNYSLETEEGMFYASADRWSGILYCSYFVILDNYVMSRNMSARNPANAFANSCYMHLVFLHFISSALYNYITISYVILYTENSWTRS